MATLADNGYPTLREITRRLGPDGKVEQQIAEVLSKENPAYDDIPWFECNEGFGHKITSQYSLPTPTWRRINQGIDPAKGDTEHYVESTGILEGRAIVDVDAVPGGQSNMTAWRLSEERLHWMGIAQELTRAFFYENATTAPERIHGVTARYAASSGYTASSYVLPKGTLSGSNCQSVWLITWGEHRVFGIYPQGSKAGLVREDKGEMLVSGANSKDLFGLVTKLQQKCGVAVHDYRYAVRLQWDPDDSTNFPDSGKTLFLGMQEMLDTIKAVELSTTFYMSRTSAKKLNAQLGSNETSLLSYVERGGKRVRSFMGVPMRIEEALIGESAIT